MRKRYNGKVVLAGKEGIILGPLKPRETGTESEHSTRG